MIYLFVFMHFVLIDTLHMHFSLHATQYLVFFCADFVESTSVPSSNGFFLQITIFQKAQQLPEAPQNSS